MAVKIMTYDIHLTQDWPHERMAPFGEEITRAMVKLAARFPDDIDLAEMARQIANGEVQLWLILDEKQKFSAFLTTQIEVTASGKKRVLLLELAGRGGIHLAGLIGKIEDWARGMGAVAICPIGRPGWQRVLKGHGYKPLIIRYGKELN